MGFCGLDGLVETLHEYEALLRQKNEELLNVIIKESITNSDAIEKMFNILAFFKSLTRERAA